MKRQFSKKYRYIIYSFIIFLLLLLIERAIDMTRSYLGVILILLLVTTSGVAFVHYVNLKLTSFLPLILLPLCVVGGALFLLVYFPNLSLFLKILLLFLVSVALYVVNLVNNIILVTSIKETPIPLFRVAVVWAQILVVAVSIPFFAGVFRGSSEFLFQNSAVALISLLFSLYLFWVLSFDGDVKQIGLGERIIVSLFVSFLVFCVGLGVSFIPTEPFLRALFLSAALMFGTGYVYSHYKNKITKDLLLEYGFILLIFFLIVLTF